MQLSQETFVKIIRSCFHCTNEKARAFVRFCDNRGISLDETNPYPMDMARDFINAWRTTERKYNVLLKDLTRYIHKNRKYPYVTDAAVRMADYLRSCISNKDNRMGELIGQVIVRKYEQKQAVNIPGDRQSVKEN